MNPHGEEPRSGVSNHEADSADAAESASRSRRN
jgi:hypothetical protein